MAVQQNFTNIKTISQLPVIDSYENLSASDLMEVSHSETMTVAGSSVRRYNSRAVELSCINSYFTFNIIQELHERYNFPTQPGHESVSSITLNDPSFDFAAAKMVYDTFLFIADDNNSSSGGKLEINYLSCPCRGRIIFRTVPMLSSDENWDYSSQYNPYMMSLEKTKGLMDSANPLFIDSNSNFSSKMFNVENNLREEESSPFGTEDEKHNRYVFRITNYKSNQWKATHSGIFTCWGWVDMHMDAQPGNNCEAWLALEGYINGKWCILQVQPFDKHNGETISYVGFTFPVHAGLELRIVSGFRVGSNSGKYQQKNGSLANHIANCFVGGIYYTPMNYQTRSSTSRDGAEGKLEFHPGDSFDFHEEKLDESKKSTIAELKAKLNAVIEKLNAIAGTNINVDDL